MTKQAMQQRAAEQPGTPEAAARLEGPRQAELTQLAASLNGSPAVLRTQALAPGQAPVQRLLNAKNKKVKIADLSLSMIRRLVYALEGGKAVPGYTFEPGDDAKLVKAFQQKTGHISSPFTADAMKAEKDEDFHFTPKHALEHHITTTARRDAGLDKFKIGRDGHEREPRPWPEKSLQGTIGEYHARNAMVAEGHAPLNLNKFALNFPGLDHISSHPKFPFEQTKLHLSESTASPHVYLNHVNLAGVYAIKAIRGLKKHEGAFKSIFKKRKRFRKNETLTDVMAALAKLEGTADDDIDGSEAHTLVTNAMRFSIPKDIYAKIPKKHRARFLPISEDVAGIKQSMSDFSEDYVPSKSKGSKPKDEDVDFKPGKG
jgi:hypothetical protein